MPHPVLDFFGQLLMTKVRDEAVSDWRMILDGQMKDETSSRIREMLASLSEDQRKVVLSLVPKIVDTVLHHLLWTLEQTNKVNVCVKTGDHEVSTVKDLSDGLAGELYSDQGWIARFSREKL